MKILPKLLDLLEPKGSINILMYHGFTDQKQNTGIENYHGKHMHVDKFEEQLCYLKENYNIISLGDLIDSISQQHHLPPKTVLITMDDGYRSNFTLAYPLLRRYEIPASLFLTTDFVCKKEFLWVDRIEYTLNSTMKSDLQLTLNNDTETYDLGTVNSKRIADQKIKSKLKHMSLKDREQTLQTIEGLLQQKLSFDRPFSPMYAPLEIPEIHEMLRSGLVTFGNHTSSHMILTVLSSEDLKNELKSSKTQVEKLTGLPCDLFCYPNGARGDFNDQTREILKNLGFKCALTAVTGSNSLGSDIFELKRLNLHNDGGMEGFIFTLSTAGRFLRNLNNLACGDESS